MINKFNYTVVVWTQNFNALENVFALYKKNPFVLFLLKKMYSFFINIKNQ